MTYAQYTDNVIGAGSPRYDNAYFQINYVRVYTVDGVTSSVLSSLHQTSTSSTSKPTGTSTSPSSGSDTSVILNAPSSLYLFVLLFVGVLAVLV